MEMERVVSAARLEMPEVARDTEERAFLAMSDLKIRGNSGAYWFFFVAAFSLVTTAVVHNGGNEHLPVGLAITTAVDVLWRAAGRRQPQIANMMMWQAIAFSVIVSGLMVLIGWLARKRYQRVFAFGILLYMLDAFLYLLFEDYPSVAVHVYVLYGMIKGFLAYRQLDRLEKAFHAPVETDPATANVGLGN